MAMSEADERKYSLNLGQVQKCTRVKPVNKILWSRINRYMILTKCSKQKVNSVPLTDCGYPEYDLWTKITPETHCVHILYKSTILIFKNTLLMSKTDSINMIHFVLLQLITVHYAFRSLPDVCVCPWFTSRLYSSWCATRRRCIRNEITNE